MFELVKILNPRIIVSKLTDMQARRGLMSAHLEEGFGV